MSRSKGRFSLAPGAIGTALEVARGRVQERLLRPMLEIVLSARTSGPPAKILRVSLCDARRDGCRGISEWPHVNNAKIWQSCSANAGAAWLCELEVEKRWNPNLLLQYLTPFVFFPAWQTSWYRYNPPWLPAQATMTMAEPTTALIIGGSTISGTRG